jgi:hypothetical protein
VCLSRQPKNKPGVSQWVVSEVDVLWTECECEVEDGEESWQPPNQPGCWHDVLEAPPVVCAVVRGTDAEDDGAAVPTVVVVGSLQPNQPGVLQVVVVEIDVLVLVLVLVVLVDVLDSSRQPHQPGVLQVVVRVRVEKDEVLVDVFGSDPLLSKYFQLKQS